MTTRDYGLDVLTRCFHHDNGDLLRGQVISQPENLVGHRPPRRHRGRRPAIAVALDPDADLRVPFGDVDTSAPRVHHLHDPHLTLSGGPGLPARTGWQGACSGEGG